MPVEQLGGIVDATTDLHALGATLFHLLSRREPWRFVEDPRAFARLNVSHGFRAFLTKLTACRPADRYPSANAATTALLAPASRRRFSPGQWALPAVALTAGFAVAFGVGGALAHRRQLAARRVTTKTSYATEIVEFNQPITVGPDKMEVARNGDATLVPAMGVDSVTTKLRICTNAAGKVTSATVLESTGGIDEDRIVQEVSRWKFPPAMIEGQARASCQEIRYEIRRN
jgi:hypothetical protein